MEASQRYLRHYLLREMGEEGQKKLLSSAVLVVGAGGLGSAAVLYLAAAGVGRIGIADDDTVSLSNLQRQVIHTAASVGVSKAASAEKAAHALNPEIEIVRYEYRLTADNIRQILTDYDFILDCTDRFESKFLINDACVLYGKPYSHAGVVEWRGQAMTYVPGQGPCLRCLLDEVPHHAETCQQVGVLGAAVGMLGCLQAAEAIKYLIGKGRLLTGRIYTLDALTMQMRVSRMPQDPLCAVCGESPGIRSLTDRAEDYVIPSDE